MEIKIELSEELTRSISAIAEKIWKVPLEKAVELMLVGTLARKAAWGSAVDQCEPGCEYVRTPAGLLEGNQLYEDVYQQSIAWINTLMIGERLLQELVTANADKMRFENETLNRAFQFYAGKKDRKEYVQ